MHNFTLQPHGPETWAIYQGNQRVVILSECSEEVAQMIVNAINPKTSGLIARVRQLESELAGYRNRKIIPFPVIPSNIPA